MHLPYFQNTRDSNNSTEKSTWNFFSKANDALRVELKVLHLALPHDGEGREHALIKDVRFGPLLKHTHPLHIRSELIHFDSLKAYSSANHTHTHPLHIRSELIH